MKNRPWQVCLAGLLAVLFVVAAVLFWRDGLGRIFSSQEALLQRVQVLGPWGPLAIVAAEILQVILAPIPGQVVGLAAGYLYGVFWGTLYCVIGLACGSLLAMWLARRLGRPLVERIASRDLLERVDGYARRRGALAFLVIWLLPFLPDDICCFIAGLTSLRLSELMLLALIGRLPGVLVSTLIGWQAHSLTLLQILVIALTSIVLAIGFACYRKQLEQTMFGLLDRFSAR